MGRTTALWRALVGACMLIGLLALPGSALAAECTNTWVGPEAGKWTEAENWSLEGVPTETDVVCIPASKQVEIDSGAQRAEVLQGEGELVISEASLVLVGLTEPSNIGTLRLKAGGELGGSGEIFVTKSLVAAGGRMKGDGYTKLGAEATGTVVGGEFEGQPGLRVAQERVFSIHGSFGVGGEDGEIRVVEAAILGVQGTLEVNGPTGAIVLRESASLTNSGTLNVAGPEARIAAGENTTVSNNQNLSVAGKEAGINATGNAELANAGKLTIAGTEGEVRIDSATLENTGELTVAGPAGRLLATEGGFLDNQGVLVVNSEAEGSGVLVGASAFPPHLENAGTVIKTQGTGTATIEVKLDNEELVQTETGVLKLSGGGTSGKAAESTWVALSENLWEAETKIVFADENFGLGEAAIIGEMQVVSGAAVTAEKVDGEVGSFWLYDGNFHISEDGTVLGELGIAGGTASLAAGAELSSEYLELTSAYLEGSGVETPEDPAELILGGGSTAHVETLTQEQGFVEMKDNATLDADSFLEAGTFKAGDQTTFTGEVFFSWVPFETGSSTQFLIEEAYVEEESFELGPGSTVSGKYFFQANGATTFGANTTITESEYIYAEEGTMAFGEGATATMPEMFYQEEADVFFDSGASLDAGEMAYFEQGLTTLEPGVSVEGEEVHIDRVIATVKSGAEIQAGILNLYEGELTGGGSVVGNELGWWNTVMTGTGTTEVLEKGKIGHGTTCSKGTCKKIPAYATLRERELILHGNFTLTVSTMGLADGAKIVNHGSFDASSEMNEWGPQMQIAAGSSSPPRVVNKGRFEKLEGSGTTVIDVPFWNSGVVAEKSGTLDLKQPLNVPASERFGFRCYCGDPVETATGDFSESQTDIAVGGLGVGLELTRSYSALAAASATPPGIFGYGWFNSFSDRLDTEEEGKRITLVRANGSTVPFTSDGKGSFDPPVWSEDTLTGSAEAGYTYKGADQTEYGFAPNGALQSVTDRNGNETTLAYTEAGRLKTIEDPAGREIALSYNGEGLVEKAEDPMGHVVQYSYEGKELVSVTMPGEEGSRWQFDYDGSHRMTTMTDGRGGEVENEYDAESRVLSQTDPAGRTLDFEYDGFHTRFTNEGTGAVTDLWFNSNNQPTSITRGYGTEDATTDRHTYDEAGHQLSRTDGNGHTTTFTYNPAGDRTSAADPEENKTEWTYNATHDVISETTPKGETTTIVRDAAGNPETVSRPAPGEAVQTASFDYDPLGQLESMTDPQERTWSFEYNVQGDLQAETDPEGNKRSWGYNENSQVTSIVSPRGNEEGAEPSEFTTTIERDAQGRPEKAIDPLGQDSEFTYDGNDNLKSTTNAKGKTTEFVYNGADELVETKKPNGTVVKTEYDDAGDVVAQIDGNEEKTTYVRNVLGQPIEVIDPLSRKTIQEFDAASNLETVVDPAERIANYLYDSADRLEEVIYLDEATPDVSFDYDADGNLTRRVDGSGESTYVYDQLGRLEETTNGHGDTVSYEYDLAGLQEKIVYPNGKDVDRTFDDAGRLESVTDWLGKTTAFVYDADSNLEQIQFPATTGNVDEFAYDPTGRMTSAEFKKGAESLASIAYERDPLGQVEAMVSEGLPGPEEETYEYDENNRLTKAGAEAFEYDKADNPIKTPGSTNAFDKASQLEAGTGVAYEYNPMGERIKATPSSVPATNYAYDQAGRLTSVKRAAEGEVPAIDKSFAFDGSGLLTSQTSGLATRHMAWDISTPLPLLLNDDVNSYIYGPYGLPIAQISAEEEPTYLHHDQLGSTRLLTDGSGKAAATYTYTAYGELVGKTGAATTPLGYAGQFTDVDTALQYLRARFYDPRTAQFLTRDPIEFLTGQPYIYANGNPQNFVDPSGLGPCVLGFIACDEEDDPCGSVGAVAASAFMAPACLVPDEASDEVANASGGIGDGISKGLTDKIRSGLGHPNAVDKESGLYEFCEILGDTLREFTIGARAYPGYRVPRPRVPRQTPRDLPERWQNPPRDLDPPW
jgi:RHS repeat-associated protein